MREIILKSIMAGPNGVRHPGKHTLPKYEAAALVKANHAEYTDNPQPMPEDLQPKEVAATAPVETRGRKKK